MVLACDLPYVTTLCVCLCARVCVCFSGAGEADAAPDGRGEEWRGQRRGADSGAGRP